MDPLPWHKIAAPIVACLVLGVVAAAGYSRFRFAALGVIAGVSYGMLQDQVSARLCPEYFTLFHNPIQGLTNPTLLGLAWGFLATWWAGMLLGYIAGLFATLGSAPKLAPREIVVPLLILMGGIAATVAISGFSVWLNSENLRVSVDPEVGRMLPRQRHVSLLVVACYHLVAYASSFAGSLVLCVWIWRERKKRATTLRLALPMPQSNGAPSLG
jgi:hypothetical protein